MPHHDLYKVIKDICLWSLLWLAGAMTNFAYAEQQWVADEIFLQMSKARLNSGQIAFEFRMNNNRINTLNSG